jgi:two-component system, response regulator
MSDAILLVEDNASDEVLTLRALKKAGFANPVAVVRDGAKALDYVFSQGSHAGRTGDLPRLVMLDLNLPKLSGLEVLRRIRADARTRSLPVVILTSSREDRDVSGGYSNGANSYVVKPVDYARFAEAIRQLGQYWLQLNVAPPA